MKKTDKGQYNRRPNVSANAIAFQKHKFRHEPRIRECLGKTPECVNCHSAVFDNSIRIFTVKTTRTEGKEGEELMGLEMHAVVWRNGRQYDSRVPRVSSKGEAEYLLHACQNLLFKMFAKFRDDPELLSKSYAAHLASKDKPI